MAFGAIIAFLPGWRTYRLAWRRRSVIPAARFRQEHVPMKDTFSVRDTLEVNGKQYAFASLAK